MNNLDGIGFIGQLFEYAFIISLSGGALIVFLYCFFKKRLDMDEEPKYQMFEKRDEPRSTGEKDE
ncbi:hypothetical protein JYU14_00730 [Simkania negevensis]|uniref:Cbb3-type cytochrome c oxidase subunit 3 n=1 Tax=Simkania negevensis TaxID=83561 RepID=A0ABS3AR66_9BACT|nr:hypothetical protein [Simkania negevensis]